MPRARLPGEIAPAAATAAPFLWPIRVYWEDTDAGGVVFHGSYVRYFERARSEYLRSLGMEQSALLRERGILFAIVGMDLRFDAPAHLDDMLEATCELTARRAASLGFRQEIRRISDNARIARAEVRAACLDATRFRPCALPTDLFNGVCG